MNSKTKAFFVITLAAILSVSLVTAGSIQPAAADKDKDHEGKENKI